jgi:hypothetical protein
MVHLESSAAVLRGLDCKLSSRPQRQQFGHELPARGHDDQAPRFRHGFELSEQAPHHRNRGVIYLFLNRLDDAKGRLDRGLGRRQTRRTRRADNRNLCPINARLGEAELGNSARIRRAAERALPPPFGAISDGRGGLGLGACLTFLPPFQQNNAGLRGPWNLLVY